MTVAEIVQKVKDLVRIQASGPFNLGDPEITRFIEDAARKYSKDAPRIVVEDVTGDGTRLLPLPASWDEGYSTIDTIESLPGSFNFLDPRYYGVYNTPTGPKIGLPYTTSAEHRITFRATHPVDLSTIPDQMTLGIAAYAASLICESFAARASAPADSTISSDVTYYRDAQLRFTQEAKKFREMYSDSFSGKSSGHASEMINWDSLPSYGSDHLVHRRRTR